MPAQHEARTETPTPYAVTPITPDTTGDDETIARAIDILFGRLHTDGVQLTAPSTVRNYLRLKLASLEHEEFGALMLDAHNRLIADERMFRGTLTQTSVYPREVVKDALAANANAVIFYHNHPSGNAEPSRADELLTTTLKSALALVDVKVLDHVIVAGANSLSFAERGLV